MLNSTFLAWNDDGGQGSDAALEFKVPADGDYKIMVAGASQPSGSQVLGLTFGDYRLLIGINSPRVLSGQATSTGQVIARLDQPSQFPIRIQEVQGVLTPQHHSTYFRLRNIDPGATLYLRVQTMTGHLKPALILKNYGDKIIRANNVSGLKDAAQLQYTFTQKSQNYSVHITTTGGQPADPRLLPVSVGLGAAEVLQGKGAPVGQPLIREPIQVRAGIHMDQSAK